MLITQGWSTEQPESDESINEYHFKGKLGKCLCHLIKGVLNKFELITRAGNFSKINMKRWMPLCLDIACLIVTYHIYKNFNFEQIRKESMPVLGVN